MLSWKCSSVCCRRDKLWGVGECLYALLQICIHCIWCWRSLLNHTGYCDYMVWLRHRDRQRHGIDYNWANNIPYKLYISWIETEQRIRVVDNLLHFVKICFRIVIQPLCSFYCSWWGKQTYMYIKSNYKVIRGEDSIMGVNSNIIH